MRPNKVEAPQQTWFFERPDGSIFATQEQEAWNIYAGRVQVAGLRTNPPKIVGVSDGRAYWKAVAEAHEISKTDIEGAKERLRKGFDEELAVAKGRIIVPRNMDTIGRDRRPTSINELMR